MIIKMPKSRVMGQSTAFIAGVIAAALVLISPSGMGQGASVVTPDSSQYVKGSLCTQPNQVVFSCPLAKSGKIVSVCAAGNASPHQFYYAFGRPNSVEMRYPDSASESSGDFSHSFLGYPGEGGYAYSFVKSGIKYIVFYISGRYGHIDGGVVVQKLGSLNALANLKCVKGKIDVTTDDSLLDETRKWKMDDDLEGHVVPTPK